MDTEAPRQQVCPIKISLQCVQTLQRHAPGHAKTTTHTQTHRHTDTQTHRHTDTQTHRDTETQRHRDTETQTHTHARTHTHTHTQRFWACAGHTHTHRGVHIPPDTKKPHMPTPHTHANRHQDRRIICGTTPPQVHAQEAQCAHIHTE